MSFESQSIPSLLNGVSQQPAVLRHPTQAEAQENCLSSLAEGLKKRPPFRILKSLSMSSNTFVHYFESTFDGTTDVFALIGSLGSVRVQRLDGDSATGCTVSYLSYMPYFIKDKTTTGTEFGLKLWTGVGVDVDFDYDITVSGGTATVQINLYNDDGTLNRTMQSLTTTGTGTLSDSFTSADNGLTLKPNISAIAGATVTLQLDIPNNMYMPSNPANYLTATTIEDYTFVANSLILPSMSGASLVPGSVAGTYQSFAALTSEVLNPSVNDVYKIQGDSSTNFNDYYVKCTVSGGDTTTAADDVWAETVAPGSDSYVQPVTMPMALVRTGETTFDFGYVDWNDRIAGDSTSAPEPNFMGKAIEDIVFYRDRLGFVAGEGITLSRPGTANGGYFAFFPETVQQTLDTDPIDIKATRSSGGKLFAGTVFNENLLLFSTQAQFVMNPNGVLTPETARIDPTTAFAASPEAKPVPMGNNVYFSISAGQYAQVREYFVTSDGATNDAADITSHIPRYIRNDITFMAGSTARDILAVVNDNELNTIYVYKFYWDGSEKKQASWSKWTLPEDWSVLGMAMLNEKFQLAVNDSNATGNFTGHLLELSFDEDSFAPAVAAKYRLNLDGLSENITANHSGGTTTFTLADNQVQSADAANYVILAWDLNNELVAPTLTWTSTTTFTATGDYETDFDLWIGGYAYNQKYTFSEQFVKRNTRNEAGGGNASQLTGRLQLTRWMVHFTESGPFKATITNEGRSTATHNYDPSDLTTPGADEIATGGGTFAFPIHGRSHQTTISLENNSWLGATWLSAEWLGRFSERPVLPGTNTTTTQVTAA